MRTPVASAQQVARLTLLLASFLVLPNCGDDDEDPQPAQPTNNGSPVAVKGCMDKSSFNYDPKATVSDGSCKEMYGCLGYATGATNSGTLGTTLNNPVYDLKMSQEVAIQRQFFSGIPANVYILSEPSIEHKNAYASSDGTIRFGYYMFYYTVQTYGELPVAGVLAHEWGHRAQFVAGWNDYNNKPAYRELEADAFSGFYMALAKQWAWSQIQSYYSNVYATGDYNFNHPQHHGTGTQRVQAAYLGVNVALQVLNTGQGLSYNQLHTLFMNNIRTTIAPRPAGPPAALAAVTYPKDLSDAYIRSLYPHL
jgi:hypothetical protein